LILGFVILLFWQSRQSEEFAREETTRLSKEGLYLTLKGLLAMLTTQQEVLEEKVLSDLLVA
jgi:methyl-accepting chemotaxis protein